MKKYIGEYKCPYCKKTINLVTFINRRQRLGNELIVDDHSILQGELAVDMGKIHYTDYHCPYKLCDHVLDIKEEEIIKDN